MEIIKLSAGEQAPKEADCIRIEQTPGGKHNLTGSALLTCGDSEEAESVTIVGGEPYDTCEEAEAAGIAWAASHCVEVLYVEGDEP
jgi:hypothetical protein